MNIVREGPKHLVIQSSDCDFTMNQLKSLYNFQVCLPLTEEIYNQYLRIVGMIDDNHTVLLLSKKMDKNLSIIQGDFEYIIIVNLAIEDVLIRLVEFKEQMGMLSIRSAPRMIVMRTTGDADKYIRMVNYDIQGDVIASNDIFERYGKGTIIIFTEKKINGPLDVGNLNPKAIFTEKPAAQISKFLNNRRVKYVNAGIEKKDWSELLIKIYDSYEQYDLHYERLTLVLDELDCGLILGETWGRDAALAFHSVDIYQIRLFTYQPTVDIKKILLGLEYDFKGERVVDYDLFVKRKKQSWTIAKQDHIRGRDHLGTFYRKLLEAELSESTKVDLFALEKNIKK